MVQADLITVLTTDLTITEVAKRHAENDYEVVKDITQPHFRKVVEEVTGTKLPDVGSAELRAGLLAAYQSATKAMFDGLSAEILAIDEIKPSVVFEAYANRDGFFSGKGKKDQFPDAFIFECLKEASKTQHVIVVSNDSDFLGPVALINQLMLVKSLPHLFTALGLQMVAPEIDFFLKVHNDELITLVDAELADWGLLGDVEDSYIEATSVTEVEVEETCAFRPIEKGEPILVVGRLSVKANAWYTHPDWDSAIYDSEDKVLIPFDEVSGETEVTFEVDVSITIGVDAEGEPDEIEELRFRNNEFQYVELHPYDWDK